MTTNKTHAYKKKRRRNWLTWSEAWEVVVKKLVRVGKAYSEKNFFAVKIDGNWKIGTNKEFEDLYQQSQNIYEIKSECI